MSLCGQEWTCEKGRIVHKVSVFFTCVFVPILSMYCTQDNDSNYKLILNPRVGSAQ